MPVFTVMIQGRGRPIEWLPLTRYWGRYTVERRTGPHPAVFFLAMITAPGVRAAMMRSAILESLTPIERLLYEVDRVLRRARRLGVSLGVSLK